MKRAIREHWKDFAAIVGLLAIALTVSAYILSNQRFQFPFTESPKRMFAVLDNAQGVTPGQGQTVEVAGVKVGRLAEVKVRDGRAVVGLDIFPRFKDLIREDATALLRPRTGLRDMFIQVDPGNGAVAAEDFSIPVSRTLSDIDLEEILRSLDRETRDYLQLLFGGAAEGLKDRGMDLAELFRRFGPTARDLKVVNRAVAQEREGIKDAIHGLARLADELAGKDDDLAQLVDSSAAVFEAFASEDRNVSATLRKLPGALRTTTSALGDVQRFAEELRPAASRLTGVFEELEQTNPVLTRVARRLTPVVRDEVRPFVREAQPLVEDLRPAAAGLGRAMPDLTSVLVRLNHLFNMVTFNPNGRESAGKEGREEGYLFWIAWLTHMTANLINVDDANGPMRPVFLTGTCDTIVNLIEGEPQLEFALGLSALLAERCGNPSTRSTRPDELRRALARAQKARTRTDRSLARELGAGG